MVHHILNQIFIQIRPFLDHNHLIIIGMDRPRRPYPRNCLRNVRNYISALLDQEQTDDTTSPREKNDSQNVSEETLLEQHFNDLFLELNQDTQEEYFNCQQEGNTLTEEYILSTPGKSNISVLSLTMYTPQSPDPRRTISPPHLGIDFLLNSDATLIILNNDTWNEIKEYHQLTFKASTFVLSAANNSMRRQTAIKRNGKINILYPNVTESRLLRNTFFTIIFRVTNTKFNILGTPFLEKYLDSMKCSSHTLEIQDNDEAKSHKINDSSKKNNHHNIHDYSRLLENNQYTSNRQITENKHIL